MNSTSEIQEDQNQSEPVDIQSPPFKIDTQPAVSNLTADYYDDEPSDNEFNSQDRQEPNAAVGSSPTLVPSSPLKSDVSTENGKTEGQVVENMGPEVHDLSDHTANETPENSFELEKSEISSDSDIEFSSE
jgi:hypothetical protein